MDLTFTKWVGAGNDFILVDWRRKKNLPVNRWSALAKNLCRQKVGIGADGILVLESSKGADFRMRIFNPDGSEAEMCGNGSRCVAAYAARGRKKDVAFDTVAGRLEARIRGDVVRVKLSPPHSLKTGVSLEVEGKNLELHTITAGVPHAIIFVDALDKIDVEGLGEKIRNHPYFQPKGTNVDFVKVEGSNRIAIRTYERGVEGETLACGTGGTASALMTAFLKGFSSPIEVLTKGGDRLKIFFKGDQFEEVHLEGKVSCLFEGRVKDV